MALVMMLGNGCVYSGFDVAGNTLGESPDSRGGTNPGGTASGGEAARAGASSAGGFGGTTETPGSSMSGGSSSAGTWALIGGSSYAGAPASGGINADTGGIGSNGGTPQSITGGSSYADAPTSGGINADTGGIGSNGGTPQSITGGSSYADAPTSGGINADTGGTSYAGMANTGSAGGSNDSGGSASTAPAAGAFSSGGVNSGGDTSCTGGDSSSGGTNVAGSTSTIAGTGGTSADPCLRVDGVIATSGTACSNEGAYACQGYNSTGRLQCNGGYWWPVDACSAGTRCDTRPGPMAGACASPLSFCSAACADECMSNTLVTCGPDMLTLTKSVACPGACFPRLTKPVIAAHCWEPSAVVSSLESPTQLAIDSSNYYWIRETAGYTYSLMSRSRDGSTLNSLASVTNGFDFFGELAVNSANVYYVATHEEFPVSGPPPVFTSKLNYMVSGGGTVQTLPTGSASITAMAVDDAFAYFAQNRTVYKHDLSTGNEIPLAGGAIVPRHFALDSTKLYWVEWSSSVAGAATIGWAKLDGSGWGTLTTAQSTPVGIAVDSTYVYWANGSASDGRIMRVPIVGGDVTMLAIGSTPKGLALHSSALYWTNNGDNSVMKLNTESGAIATVATSQSNPTSILVVGNALFWLNSGTGTDGAIMRLPL